MTADLLTTADADAQEARAARDRPLPQHREHPIGCLCRERCLVEEYDPAEEGRSW